MTTNATLLERRPSQLINLGPVFMTCVYLASILFVLRWIARSDPNLAGPAQMGTIAAIGLACLYVCWRFLVIALTRYQVNAETMRVSDGVINRRHETIELFRIKDISVVQPFWLRPFGLGHVILLSSDHTCPSLRLAAINGSLEVLELMRKLVDEARTRKGVREFD